MSGILFFIFASCHPLKISLSVCIFPSWESYWPHNTLYDEIDLEINAWLDNVTTMSGATIKDIFPTKFDELLFSIQRTYVSLYLNLAYLLPEYVYWEIPGFDHVQYSKNSSFGSELYHQIKNDFNISFVQSGVLKDFFEFHLLNVYDPAENVTFDELVDTVYREFNIESEMGFDTIFPLIYTKQHAMLINLALRIREETDVWSLTTTYLR